MWEDFLFKNGNFGLMKKTLYIIVTFIAAFMAFLEQSRLNPNKYILVGSIAVFMLGLMQLMSKVPSKNQDEHNGGI